jgi:hypothetical protein
MERVKRAGTQKNAEALRWELGTYDIDLTPGKLDELRKE